MDLEEFNYFNRPAYRFKQLTSCLPENLYAFMGKDFDVKSFKGDSHLSLNDQIQISLVNQTHSSIISNCNGDAKEADGIIVRKGEAGGIMTADCTPVIIYSREKNIGSVIHCGWVGTFADITQNAILKLKESGVNVSNSVFLIGPAAQECCYEVQAGFLNELRAKQSIWFKSSEKIGYLDCCFLRKDKNYASIPNLLHNVALEAGFLNENIIKANECTICDSRFFSYRREGSSAGRQLSILNLTTI